MYLCMYVSMLCELDDDGDDGTRLEAGKHLSTSRVEYIEPAREQRIRKGKEKKNPHSVGFPGSGKQQKKKKKKSQPPPPVPGFWRLVHPARAQVEHPK